jgi:tetratricopeptide (TPR) repeat protein
MSHLPACNKQWAGWLLTILVYPLLLVVCVLGCGSCLGQSDVSAVTNDLKKPEKYENRPLGYEKTDQTKFKVPRRFIQNTVTHYNYYFNANNKLNEVVARAKAQNRDDYTQLLPFYNYSLDITAKDKRNLDSVLDKVNTGVLIHDLRNDWVDNLFMLMGRAYYYKKEFDSAYITFQFVNFAFRPKDKDGNDKAVGSNSDAEKGGNSLSISTNEKRNIAKKIFSLPPSRNESLIWQIRTFLAMNNMTRASALIEILKQDPQFPARLQPELEEMQSLFFYQQNMYDSAAVHLEKALDNANGKLELARWEYLIAQLYEKSDKHELARQFYERSVQHTYDPIMDVYARLNAIRQSRGKDAKEDFIQKNIEALEKMARKENYAPYRDIIYFAAAEMELERNSKPGAIGFLRKSVQFAIPNSILRDKAFLMLGDFAIEQKKYRDAKNYYDSVRIVDVSNPDNVVAIKDRKKALDKIVEQMDIIERQDSLQRIAYMTPEERNAYIKKMLKGLRKQRGLAEEEQPGGQNFAFNSNNAGNADMFNTGSNAEWYFYNNSLKSKGYNDFKAKWGNRPNVDNWMLSSLVARQKLPGNNNEPGKGNALENNNPQAQVAALTTESLLANVPLTPEKMKKSNDSIEAALYILGKSYQDYIPDYLFAINTYDTLLKRFPNTGSFEQTLFNLYYCYKKLGDETDAKNILQLLEQNYPSGKYTNKIKNPEANDPEKTVKEEATRQYEKVYSDFIEGNFDEALAERKKADSLYGDKYWTPQLLYIEAVYFVHRREDSLAIVELNNVIKKYNGTPIAAKAKNMLDALKRRKELEEYLTNLKIEKAADDTSSIAQNNNNRIVTVPKPELKIANKNEKTHTDSLQVAKGKQPTDTSAIIKKPPAFVSVFSFTPDKPHGVAILMVRVDPVYVTETRNAFNRYNRENYYNSTFDIVNVPLDDTTKLVVINGFDSAGSALDYMQKAQKMAPREIIPWLPATKYSFLIISSQNLELLKNNKDMAGYKKFLSAYFPGKF